MKRLRGFGVVFAVLLAALLPVAQAPCLLMPLQAHAARTPAAQHACCNRAAGATAPCHRTTTDCCSLMPASAIPTAAVALPLPAGAAAAVIAAAVAISPTPALAAPPPAPDIGSPPLPLAGDAHGLRAPPLTV